MAIETPQYTVLDKKGRIELRRYSGYITATIAIRANSYNAAANRAFSILADYIFGNNTKNTKIAMTAPVISQKPIISEKIAMTAPVITSKLEDQTYAIAFTMPSKYSIDNLPKPNNDEISIKIMPAHEVVAITFSGYTTEGKVQKMAKELKDWASQKQIKITGEPLVLRYDPPWKPGFIRKNEVCFSVL